MDRYITTVADAINALNRADADLFLVNRKVAQAKAHRAAYRAKLKARRAARK